MIQMPLPDPIRRCMDALEAQGYAAYCVGGCVRDALLGRTPHDYDLCTAATPDQMKALFRDHTLVLAGEKHGTVGIVTEEGVVEITTFRQEGGYQDCRRPDWVQFVPQVEADLARRDFTVNAIAWSPTRGMADPFGGARDLQAGILRAVGDPAARFQEDALRILRCVRFSVCYGLTPEPETARAAEDLAPLLDNLAKERIFGELCRILLQARAEDLIRFAPILTQVIPELAPALGFDQHSVHHAFDLYTHIAQVTQAVPAELPLRWAALLHDVGKVTTFSLDEAGEGHFYGHAEVSAAQAEAILTRLKAPTALRERVCLLVRLHMNPLTGEEKLLRRRLNQYGPQVVRQLLALQRADFGNAAELDRAEARLEALCAEGCLRVTDLAIGGRELMALGYAPGPEIGKVLHSLLAQVQEGLPNTREALLAAVPKP